jgi:hypothetical protein
MKPTISMPRLDLSYIDLILRNQGSVYQGFIEPTPSDKDAVVICLSSFCPTQSAEEALDESSQRSKAHTALHLKRRVSIFFTSKLHPSPSTSQ